MGRLVRAIVLAAGIGTLMSAGGLVTVAPAQEKKAKQKDTKAAKDEIGVTEVYKAKDGWRFRVKNAEGKSIAIGTTGEDTKEDALKLLEQVKNTLAKGKVDVLKETK